MLKPSTVRAIKACGDTCANNLPTLEALEKLAPQFPGLEEKVKELREMHDYLDVTGKMAEAAAGV